MRVAFEVAAVLERPRLALVDVHRQVTRRRLVAHDAPLAPGRKASTAEPAQASVRQRSDHRLGAALAPGKRRGERIATAGAVGGIADVRGRRGRRCRRGQGRGQRVDAGMADPALPGERRRRLLAAADAGRADHAHAVRRQARTRRVEEALRAGELATEPRAHPQRPQRHRRVVGDDVEVVIEARDLVDLGHRQPHLGGERYQMPLPQRAMGILQAVQMLDQPVAPMTIRRRRTDGRADLGQRARGSVATLARDHADRPQRGGIVRYRRRTRPAAPSTHRCLPLGQAGAIGHTRSNNANIARCTAPGFQEAPEFESGRQGRLALLTIVRRLQFCQRDLADRFQQSAMIEPVGGEFAV